MDGAVFPFPLWGGQQEEPFDLQRVFGGELQAADGELAFAGYQQIFGVHETGEAEGKVRQSPAKEFSGKRNQ